MKTKIIFFGSTSLSASCLQHLLTQPDFEVSLVVCQPDNPKSKKSKMYGPVKQVALDHHLNYIQPEILSDAYETLASLNVNLGVCVAYGQFIGAKIRNLFNLGIINVHPSLLPKYRGGAPVAHAIWNNDKTTAISIMKIIKEMDAGPYCLQQKIDIDSNWTAGDLMDVVSQQAPQLLTSALRSVLDNTAIWIQQDDAAATFAPILTREQEHIDWTQSALSIVRHIKAFSPTPATFATFDNNQTIKFFNAEVGTHTYSNIPGTINAITKTYICVQSSSANTCVHITEFLLPGKKRMSVTQYQGKYPFKTGDLLQ